jgi:hypothetical protein
MMTPRPTTLFEKSLVDVYTCDLCSYKAFDKEEMIQHIKDVHHVQVPFREL